jgi:hypothetical protein
LDEKLKIKFAIMGLKTGQILACNSDLYPTKGGKKRIKIKKGSEKGS